MSRIGMIPGMTVGCDCATFPVLPHQMNWGKPQRGHPAGSLSSARRAFGPALLARQKDPTGFVPEIAARRPDSFPAARQRMAPDCKRPFPLAVGTWRRRSRVTTRRRFRARRPGRVLIPHSGRRDCRDRLSDPGQGTAPAGGNGKRIAFSPPAWDIALQTGRSGRHRGQAPDLAGAKRPPGGRALAGGFGPRPVLIPAGRCGRGDGPCH